MLNAPLDCVPETASGLVAHFGPWSLRSNASVFPFNMFFLLNCPFGVIHIRTFVFDNVILSRYGAVFTGCHSSSSFRYMLSLLVSKQCHQVRKGFIAFLLDDIACQQAMTSCKKGLYCFLTWWHCLLTLHVDLQCRHCETLIVVLYKCSKQHFVTHPIHGGDTGCFF